MYDTVITYFCQQTQEEQKGNETELSDNCTERLPVCLTTGSERNHGDEGLSLAMIELIAGVC